MDDLDFDLSAFDEFPGIPATCTQIMEIPTQQLMKANVTANTADDSRFGPSVSVQEIRQNQKEAVPKKTGQNNNWAVGLWRQSSPTGGEKDEKKKEKQDLDYFRSYADVAVHEEMLSDAVRTNAYRYAILKNYEDIRGKIVADVGAGTGILSVFCVHAGAKKVYAIEASDMATQTRAIVEENKMSDRIDVVHNTVENVIFPEKLDVIVSEWMGYCLLYESMLPSVIQCRDKWLKEDGLMLPSSTTLYMAPFTDNDYENRLGFWSEIRSVYKLSMESMKSYAQKCIAKYTDEKRTVRTLIWVHTGRKRTTIVVNRHVHVNSIPPESVQAHAQPICSLDLKHVTLKDIQNVRNEFTFRCFGHTKIHGFTTWFVVGFPESVSLTTSPYSGETHWSQTLFYLDEPLSVTQDTVIKGSISIQPHPDAPRFLDINIMYQVDDGPKYHKYYFMNDCIT